MKYVKHSCKEDTEFLYRLIYLYKECKLLVMAPSSIHKDILSSFDNFILSFIASISLSSTRFELIVHMNKAVTYHKDGDEDECEGISNFQLIIRNTAESTPCRLTSVTRWIGEVSFTVSSSDTHTHLKNLVAGNTTWRHYALNHTLNTTISPSMSQWAILGTLSWRGHLGLNHEGHIWGVCPLPRWYSDHWPQSPRKQILGM